MNARTKIIRGATAWNEMSILDEEGRAGYHLVDFGILRLALERSEQPWEHLRVIFASPRVLGALREAGWSVVGTWLAFTYLKRPASESGATGVPPATA